MGLANTETQIQWAAANTKSIASSSTATSDAQAIDATTVAASVAIRADNDGTAASGDTVDVYALYSNGDVSGAAGSDSYATGTAGVLLATLDTNISDPREAAVNLPIIATKNIKFYAVNNSSGRAITVAIRLMEKRAS